MSTDPKSWWHQIIKVKDETCMGCHRFPEDYHEWLDMGKDRRLCYDCVLNMTLVEGSTVH